ncbi:DUF1707 and DUF2154 domain-containing protein [Streptomyces sp. RKND-216]|uniref:DUF1707 SHOCT-like domain-containing protein n=1 Tax=Streptomyces sp. RKND-216 TaxID=2562581 RepID=UPI00109DA2DF|nr:DUF1707 domain-containing protein [Streptomyces sp. RKND-216]THA24721.1 DUF1707 and DUF2154 domain-containing protein [Streptomyces sp. RKND-216]
MTDSPLEKRPSPDEKPAVRPAAEADVRASDADRDRVADILREALAEGRLDADEHSERLDAVYAAKTMGQLEPLVRDLPQPVGRTALRPAAAFDVAPHGDEGAADNAVAIFSGATRRGSWRIGRKTNAFACFGGVDIDLTQAVFTQREIVINATAVFGGVDIRIPENVTLRGRGTGIFGGFDVRSHDSPDPDAPVVVVKGLALFGGVSARPKRGKRLKNLHQGHGHGH